MISVCKTVNYDKGIFISRENSLTKYGASKAATWAISLFTEKRTKKFTMFVERVVTTANLTDEIPEPGKRNNNSMPSKVIIASINSLLIIALSLYSLWGTHIITHTYRHTCEHYVYFVARTVPGLPNYYHRHLEFRVNVTAAIGAENRMSNAKRLHGRNGKPDDVSDVATWKWISLKRLVRSRTVGRSACWSVIAQCARLKIHVEIEINEWLQTLQH